VEVNTAHYGNTRNLEEVRNLAKEAREHYEELLRERDEEEGVVPTRAEQEEIREKVEELLESSEKVEKSKRQAVKANFFSPTHGRKRKQRDQDASSESETGEDKDARKLIWNLKLKAIPIFNGERDACLINNFEEAIMRCGEVMGRLNDDQFMISIMESKVGVVAQTWKRCLSGGRGQDRANDVTGVVVAVKEILFPNRDVSNQVDRVIEDRTANAFHGLVDPKVLRV
jgi:hypothetical protein